MKRAKHGPLTQKKMIISPICLLPLWAEPNNNVHELRIFPTAFK